MSKKIISYRELLSEVSAELKRESAEAGTKFDVTKVGKATSERWTKIKAGEDDKYEAQKPGTGTTKPKKPKKGKKGKKHASSESEDEEEHSTKKYVHHHVITAQDILDNVDLSEDSREKIKAFMASSKKSFCNSKKGKKTKKKKRRRRRKTSKRARTA